MQPVALAEVPAREKQPAIACYGECGGDPENPEHECAMMVQVDSWPITDQARGYRSLRIELRLGLGAAARALGIDVVTAGGIERGRYVPYPPDSWATMADALRAAADAPTRPAPIPDDLL